MSQDGELAATREVPNEHRADWDMVKPCNGEFVGSMEEWEISAFDRLCEAGLARRMYLGASGLMGLARVSLSPAEGG